MDLLVAALFFLLPLLLGMFFKGVANAAMNDRSRLPLKHSEIELQLDAGIPNHEVTNLYVQRQVFDWAKFAVQYAGLFLLLALALLIWRRFEAPVLESIATVSAEDLRQITGYAAPLQTDVSRVAIFVLAGLLPFSVLVKRWFSNSILYPFLIFHVYLAAACCVADLLDINAPLSIADLSSSVLSSMIWFVITSHAVWAFSYPNPLRAALYVLLGVVFSVALAVIAFAIVSFFSAFYGPTLATFVVYVSFGYGVF